MINLKYLSKNYTCFLVDWSTLTAGNYMKTDNMILACRYCRIEKIRNKPHTMQEGLVGRWCNSQENKKLNICVWYFIAFHKSLSIGMSPSSYHKDIIVFGWLPSGLALCHHLYGVQTIQTITTALTFSISSFGFRLMWCTAKWLTAWPTLQIGHFSWITVQRHKRKAALQSVRVFWVA